MPRRRVLTSRPPFELVVAVLAVLGATLWLPSVALAATIPVTTTIVDPNPTGTDGECSLVEAFENARQQGQPFADCPAGTAGANTIELRSGQTYKLTGPLPTTSGANALAFPFVAGEIVVDGKGATIVRDAGEYRLFYVAGGNLTLNDLTISKIVLPSTADGAIYNDNGTVTLKGVTIADVAPVAGGSGGGAVTNRANGTQTASLTIVDSVLRNNTSVSTSGASGTGGAVNTLAIMQGHATTTITNTRVSDNVATNQGGGISNAAYFNDGAAATTTIERSSVTGNKVTGLGGQGGFGGGIANFTNAPGAKATLIVRNTTISANEAPNGYGGGIFHEAGCGQGNPCGQAEATLEHVTVASNSAGREPTGLSRGGGIYVNDQSVAPGSKGSAVTTIRNVLASANVDSTGAAANCRDVPLSFDRQGVNLASDATCDFTQATTAEIGLGPLAHSAFTHSHPLNRGSVAIDRVTSCSLTVDQLGNTRPRGNGCDVGAVESGGGGE